MNARKCPDPPVGAQTSPGRALAKFAFPGPDPTKAKG